jgi:NAD(P)H-nitrite reductase large subunit
MKVVIIGNGISGITAARFIRKHSNYSIYVISKETDHFYSRTALMYIYMGHMTYEHTKPYADDFWTKNRINLIRATVKKIAIKKKHIHFAENLSPMAYDALIIASGSVTNKYGWPGQDFNGVGGLYSIQDLEYMEKYSENLNKAVIVGGGLIGVEMAEMFHAREIPVTMLVREKEYWHNVLPLQEASMVSNHLHEHGIDLRLDTELEAILGDDQNRVSAVKTKSGDQIDCGFVGITTGVRPNIDWLEGQGIETERGILVNEYFQTNIPNIYAIGDCAQFRSSVNGRKPVEQVWYTGRIMGETVAATICGKPSSYQPEYGLILLNFLTLNIRFMV